jgi:S-formylglutathione hydrolase FrmB
MHTRRALALGLCLLAAIPATASGAGLEVTGRAQLSPRLTELTMRTPSLDFPVRLRILVPDRYGAEPKRRYPVLYLLHGSFATSASWTDAGDAERTTAGQPVIVVMPPMTGKGEAGGWASDWRNEGRGGPPEWETFLIDELIPWADANLRTLPERGKRAIAGLSMGGFSAMSLAARHPDLFAAAGSFSGAVDTNYAPAQSVVQGETLADGGTTPDAIWGPRAVDEVYWRAHNPWDLAGNLRGVALSLRTGNGQAGPYDSPSPYTEPVEYGVHEMNVSFHDRLAALGIPHVWDDYGPGTHTWPYWQRDLRADLPRFMAAFAHPAPAPSPFTYVSAEPSYEVYGWHVAMRRSATEFSALADASARGFTMRGSGSASVVTAPLYEPGSSHAVTLVGSGSPSELPGRADRAGRLHLEVPLGPGNPGQQYRPGTLETRTFSTRVIVGGGGAANRCLARRAAVGSRGVGQVGLGSTRRALLRRAPPPRRRTRRSWRWCVERSRGAVRALFSRRGRVLLVATTAPGHRASRVHPGARVRVVSRVYPQRRALLGGVYRAGLHSRLLIGVRRGRVRYLAVASVGLLRSPGALRAYLRRATAAGLCPGSSPCGSP